MENITNIFIFKTFDEIDRGELLRLHFLQNSNKIGNHGIYISTSFEFNG